MCRDIVSEQSPAEIECPVCGGAGCSECERGWFTVTECPSRYIGQELIQDIQVVTCSEHHLPAAGGILDQTAWWMELTTTLQSDEAKIRDDKYRR